MHCPFCRFPDSRVIDSRTSDDGTSIRRRRQCPDCQRRFSTLETSSLQVVKRSGVVEPFSREKVIGGLRKASQGRPVSDDDLARLAQQVEETVRASGASQVDAHDVGTAILAPLRSLDEVAYLRFASVYSSYDSLEDFEAAIAALRADRSAREDAQGAAPAQTSATAVSTDVGGTGREEAHQGASPEAPGDRSGDAGEQEDREV
ncbi:MAG: transcriptional regulator NrdR [Actinomycetaceae bacterium]